MEKSWPKELVDTLAEVIADRISTYNATHAAAANISQDQKGGLEDALGKVFGKSDFMLHFASRPNY